MSTLLKVLLTFLFLIKWNTATTERTEIDLSFFVRLSDLPPFNQPVLFQTQINGLDTILKSVFTILSFVSLTSLVFVFIIFMVVPGLNNLYGKIIFNNVVSMSLNTTSSIFQP